MRVKGVKFPKVLAQCKLPAVMITKLKGRGARGNETICRVAFLSDLFYGVRPDDLWCPRHWDMAMNNRKVNIFIASAALVANQMEEPRVLELDMEDLLTNEDLWPNQRLCCLITQDQLQQVLSGAGMRHPNSLKVGWRDTEEDAKVPLPSKPCFSFVTKTFHTWNDPRHNPEVEARVLQVLATNCTPQYLCWVGNTVAMEDVAYSPDGFEMVMLRPKADIPDLVTVHMKEIPANQRRDLMADEGYEGYLTFQDFSRVEFLFATKLFFSKAAKSAKGQVLFEIKRDKSVRLAESLVAQLLAVVITAATIFREQKEENKNKDIVVPLETPELAFLMN